MLYMKNSAQRKLLAATIVDKDNRNSEKVSNERTQSNAWLYDQVFSILSIYIYWLVTCGRVSSWTNLKLNLWKDHEALDKLAKHTELLIGLKIKNQQQYWPNVPSSEPWQIGVYGPGGHFMPHFDGFQQVGPAMGFLVCIHLITGGHRWVWGIPPIWAWNMGGQPRSYCLVLPLQRPWWLHSISWHGGSGQAQGRICSVLVQSWQANRDILSTSILHMSDFCKHNFFPGLTQGSEYSDMVHALLQWALNGWATSGSVRASRCGTNHVQLGETKQIDLPEKSMMEQQELDIWIEPWWPW